MFGLVKDGGEWKIAAYHNVDVKSEFKHQNRNE
jgi:hypothetical protein